MLWVTQSYSNNILQLQPWMLVPNSNTSMGMSTITLPRQDRFSPFGIAIVRDLQTRRSLIFVHACIEDIS